MEAIATLATIAFILVAGIAGTRLLMLARRTRQIPELSVGSALILVVFVGYPLSLAAVEPATDPAVARLLFAVSTMATAIGSTLIFVFTRAVFRPDAAWARVGVALAALVILSLGGVATLEVLRGASPRDVQGDPLTLVRYSSHTVGYVWTMVEALLYHSAMLRRRAIGLADPVVTNRFLLWAISGGAATAGLIAAIANVWVGGGGSELADFTMLVLGIAGLTSAASTYLAFMPPAAWVRWISGSMPQANATP